MDVSATRGDNYLIFYQYYSVVFFAASAVRGASDYDEIPKKGLPGPWRLCRSRYENNMVIYLQRLTAKDEVNGKQDANGRPQIVEFQGFFQIKHGERHEDRQGDDLLQDLELAHG